MVSWAFWNCAQLFIWTMRLYCRRLPVSQELKTTLSFSWFQAIFQIWQPLLSLSLSKTSDNMAWRKLGSLGPHLSSMIPIGVPFLYSAASWPTLLQIWHQYLWMKERPSSRQSSWLLGRTLQHRGGHRCKATVDQKIQVCSCYQRGRAKGAQGHRTRQCYSRHLQTCQRYLDLSWIEPVSQCARGLNRQTPKCLTSCSCWSYLYRAIYQ